MTPKSIKLRIERFAKQKEEDFKHQEYFAWLNGYYHQFAIAASMSRKIKYPENPLKDTVEIVEDMELTEEEKEQYRNDFLRRLQRMEKRFNDNQSNEGE